LKIFEEVKDRGYSYNKSKIVKIGKIVQKIQITKGQLEYEYDILKKRLSKRDSNKYWELCKLETEKKTLKPHPIFTIIKGDVETWETSYWKKKISRRKI
jgi:hypothetical protein